MKLPRKSLTVEQKQERNIYKNIMDLINLNK